MFKKFNGFQILVASIFIGNPLAVFFTVIQVKHGRYRVYPYTVNVKLLDPEQYIGYQEVFHLGLAIIKNLGSPVRMLSLTRVRIFKNTLAVKPSESMGIYGKMSGNPVQNDAYFVLM